MSDDDPFARRPPNVSRITRGEVIRWSVIGGVLAIAGVVGALIIPGLIEQSRTDYWSGGVVTGDGDQRNVHLLSRGTCLNDLSGAATDLLDDGIGSLPTVDCDEVHDSEVFARAPLSGADAAFPGDGEIVDTALEECRTTFESYVGTSYDDALLLDIYPYVPTAEGWSNGDRMVLCTVVGIDGDGSPIRVIGSVAGLEGERTPAESL